MNWDNVISGQMIVKYSILFLALGMVVFDYWLGTRSDKKLKNMGIE